MSETVLAVVAHPDDESFLMGSTLAQHAENGDRVVVLALSDGVGSRFRWWQPFSKREAAHRRRLHFSRACQVLGVVPELRIVFQDQRASSDQLRINRAVAEAVNRYNPARVYSHAIHDLNADHRHVSEAVRLATRGRCCVYEAEGEWPSRAIDANPPKPKTVKVLHKWRKLMACLFYQDEMRKAPHPRSMQEILKRKVERFWVIQ